MTSEHINPKIRCYLDASVEERVNYIRSDPHVGMRLRQKWMQLCWRLRERRLGVIC